jgi:hypothetical protein
MQEDDKTTNIRREYWERTRRKWYNLYFFMGIGINLILYFTKPYGFDPGGSIFWGTLVGTGIPFTTMFLFTYIHKRMIGL